MLNLVKLHTHGSKGENMNISKQMFQSISKLCTEGEINVRINAAVRDC